MKTSLMDRKGRDQELLTVGRPAQDWSGCFESRCSLAEIGEIEESIQNRDWLAGKVLLLGERVGP